MYHITTRCNDLIVRRFAIDERTARGCPNISPRACDCIDRNSSGTTRAYFQGCLNSTDRPYRGSLCRRGWRHSDGKITLVTSVAVYQKKIVGSWRKRCRDRHRIVATAGSPDIARNIRVAASCIKGYLDTISIRTVAWSSCESGARSTCYKAKPLLIFNGAAKTSGRRLAGVTRR